MKRHFLLAIALLLSSNVFSAYVPGIGADTLGADSIIKKSKEVYAASQIYLDSGKVITEFKKQNPIKTALYFKTAYSTKDGFNFEYFEAGKSNSYYVINKSAQGVKSWWGITNRTQSFKDLSMPLAAATGVSSSTSINVPRLLMPVETGAGRNIYQSLGKPIVLKSELLDGLPCYKLISKAGISESISIWVSKKDFFIRRIEQERKMNPSTTKEIFKKSNQLLAAKFLADSVAMRKKATDEMDLNKKAGIEKQIDSLSKSNVKFMKLRSFSENMPRDTETYIVKTTSEYHPYILKKMNKELFAFKPNREVRL